MNLFPAQTLSVPDSDPDPEHFALVSGLLCGMDGVGMEILLHSEKQKTTTTTIHQKFKYIELNLNGGAF